MHNKKEDNNIIKVDRIFEFEDVDPTIVKRVKRIQNQKNKNLKKYDVILYKKTLQLKKELLELFGIFDDESEDLFEEKYNSDFRHFTYSYDLVLSNKIFNYHRDKGVIYNLIQLITKWRLFYEKNIFNGPHSKLQGAHHRFTQEILSSIADILRSNYETTFLLNRSENRIQYYQKVLSSPINDKEFVLHNNQLLSLLFAIESSLNILGILTSDSNDRIFNYLFINKFDDENDDIDYKNELVSLQKYAYHTNQHLVCIYNPTKHFLIDSLSYFKPKLVHYSGHSGKSGFNLIYYDKTINGKFIADIYYTNKARLNLSVFNSCSSEKISEQLVMRTGGSSIGTITNILSTTAEEFPCIFYKRLINDTITKSFSLCINKHNPRFKDYVLHKT